MGEALPRNYPFSHRALIWILIVVNAIAIVSSEVQRRALIEYSMETQGASATKLERSVHSAELARSAKIDNLEFRLTSLSIALAQLSDAKLSQDASLDTPSKRDALRIYHVALLRGALERYRRDHKAFPSLSNNPVTDLATALVSRGYLAAIPVDPSGRPYMYTTDGSQDGQRYGLRVHREIGGDCLTGEGAEGRGWWALKTTCPF